METKVFHCTCKSEFQDEVYGKGNRLFNPKGKGDKVVYDLQGRPVVTPQKNGLYIKNKKKFIYR